MDISDLARVDLNNSIIFSVEAVSVKLPIQTMIDRLIMYSMSNMPCHMRFSFSKHAPLSRTPDQCKDNATLLLLILVRYQVVIFASQQSAR